MYRGGWLCVLCGGQDVYVCVCVCVVSGVGCVERVCVQGGVGRVVYEGSVDVVYMEKVCVG